MNYINNYIIPELEDIKLDKLTTVQIQKFYNDLQKNGRVQRYQHIELKNKGLSVRVVHGIHTLLNNCLEQALAERLILVNPARGCKLPIRALLYRAWKYSKGKTRTVHSAARERKI